MQAVLDASHAAVHFAHDKGTLGSYDSGEEFSIYHWIEVCRLVDECDVPLEAEGLPYCEQIEEALEETISEVEASAAYQHFPGNVV